MSVVTDPGIEALKQHIADEDNAVIGLNVWANFDHINNFDTVYCVADVYGTNRGGHALCIVGYDDNKSTNDGPGAFRLMNSWGTGWGNHGYFWMSYVAVKSSVTCHGTAYYTTDLIGYSPTITARFKVSHSKREWINIHLGWGLISSPVWYKSFFNWYITPQQGRPFPNNNIVVDLSDGISHLNAYDVNNVFLRCQDPHTDGQSGTIQYLSSVNNKWGAFSLSFETPQTIPDDGTAAFANLSLPTQKLHWQCFHRLPDNTGVTQLTGDMDSVELLWSYQTGPVFSSLCLGDINGDSTLEVIVGSVNDKIYALGSGNGDSLWTYTTGDSINSSPCLGDIDEDGKLEIVIGSDNNKIYALNGEDGSFLWSYTTGGDVSSSPALGDIDGDGKLEVVVGSSDYKVYALNGADGSFLWSYTTGGSVESSPALGDIDGDGVLEVVVGSYDCKVYALNGKDGSFLWSYTTGSAVRSSPAIGDIDEDGKLEVVVGSCYDCKVHALNGEDGSLLWSYTTGSNVYSSPALGDIDEDGKLEVVVGSYDCNIYALNGEDGSFLWSYTTGGNINSSPALGDIDGDGNLEVVIGSDDDKVYALNGEDGSFLWSYTTGGNINSSPALGDIDGDGNLEVVVGSSDNYIYALDGIPFGIKETDISGNTNPHFSLLQNHPNPFATYTTINYSLSKKCKVELELFDVCGRQVAIIVNEIQKAGHYQINWDIHDISGKQLPNGIYFYRLKAGDYAGIRKMIIVR